MNIEQYINENGFIVYPNVGISMMPIIREGKDLMYIKKVDRPLKRLDPILFKRPGVVGRGAYVLHRIMKVNKDNTYFVMGDNEFRGEIVKQENVLGILVSVKRNDKDLMCDSIGYKIYVYVWWFIFPIRAGLRIVKKIIRKIIKG